MDEEKGRHVNRVIAREFLIFLFAYGLPLVLWVILLALYATELPYELGLAAPPREPLPEAGPVLSLKQLLVPLLIYLPVQAYCFIRRRRP